MEPNRSLPRVTPSANSETSSSSKVADAHVGPTMLTDEIAPATPAELDQEEERAIEQNEHR